MAGLDRLAAALADRYRLERELGQGGMATVYLAEDLKHERKVAIKVLHPELSAVIGGERFLAEIKTTASLQHPHILGLIDSGDADGLLYYVMPFIEGETLRGRLAREKQLPVDDAVRLAKEVAAALEFAHKRGIVHRDIKPENILLQDGSALVADFGIALAVQQAGGSRMTQTGMSLGTPAYMSPEQAMGERDLGPRSDVYALGAMTYEMLVGEPPFTGPTSQAIVARVLTESPPPLRPKRATVPPAVEEAVLVALQKLPADRFGTAREFAEALEGHGKAPRLTGTVALPATRPPARSTPLRLLPWTLAAVGLALAGWSLARRPAPPGTEWQYLALGATPPLELALPSLALSPDGRTLVFATAGTPGQLWVKRFTELEPKPIPGTNAAIYPTFSPDGEWIAFTGDGTLRKVRPDGSGLTVLADSASRDFGGAAWLDDDTIVFTGPAVGEVSRVAANGGTRERAIGADFRGFGMGGLAPVPGSRGILFIACNSGCVTSELHVLDLRSGTHHRLVQDASAAWILPDGTLLYMRRDGVAQAAPFDMNRLEITGPAVPIVQGVFGAGGGTQFAWSPSGTVVYLPGAGTLAKAVPVRATRAGSSSPVDPDWIGPFSHPAVAPGGRQIAVTAGVAQGDIGIWIKQLPRGAFTRLTFSGQDRRPAWSPDGRTVAFVRDTLAGASVWARPADGSREPYRLSPPGIWAQGVTWSPDGTWLAIRTDNGDSTRGDIVGIRLGADGTPAPPVPLVASPFGELNPAFSPDGKWLAYSSDESGTNEVFVRPFPNTTAARWQVSNGGGEQPRWSPDGRALYYLERTGGRLVEARLRTAPAFEVLERVPLFAGDNVSIDPFHQSYDVWPDGSGFLFVRSSTGATGTEPLVLGRHWFTDVRARLRR